MSTRRYNRQRYSLAFGLFAKRLREARALTQEQLAEFAELSPDTIRRLEHGSFSPSLGTLIKLTSGLRMDVASLFTGFELQEVGNGPQLVALCRSLDPREIQLAIRILSVLVILLKDIIKAENIEAGASNNGDYTGGNDGQ